MVAIYPRSPIKALPPFGYLIPSLLLSSLLLAPLVSSQTVIVITVAPPIPSEAPSFTNHDTFTSAIINSTNFHRTAHNASTVRWNDTLAAFASGYLSSHSSSSPYSQKETCRMKHSGGPYGENLALGCSDAGDCVDLWGNEDAQYNYDDPGFSEATGHFTQLVWRDTTDVGCGAKLCPGNYGWYLACEYWPRGNIIGAFAGEVGPESGAAALRTKKGVGSRAAEVLVVGAAMVAWWGLV
ncbi:PR-1-like protein [Daldinia loculata]|uniref:PR-1-like protein n=1 Tax=Daldinia loculata TaxID=103429 RepID=UPI0020C58EB4|nr:PR-1-like protein [Daldinia loculata]KAI1643369.1 PR-1-like protein [Daldinia loculata]